MNNTQGYKEWEMYYMIAALSQHCETSKLINPFDTKKLVKKLKQEYQTQFKKPYVYGQ